MLCEYLILTHIIRSKVMLKILFRIFNKTKINKKDFTYKSTDKEVIALLKELEYLNIKYDNATKDLLANINQRELYEGRRLDIKKAIIAIEDKLEKKGIIKNDDE